MRIKVFLQSHSMIINVTMLFQWISSTYGYKIGVQIGEEGIEKEHAAM